MIEIRNLTRNYGDLVALSDVSLTIERDQIVGLLGHNGAGKTTMMKMLTGFIEPTSGSVTIDGVDVVVGRDQVQKRIGYLPENAPLYPEMLVQEYLAMMAELRGVPADRTRAAVVAAARATGLTDRLVQPIGTLSKGFRQRVGLAQAIVHEPDVLILDEPTNGLDPTQIRAIRELISELGKKTTILLSTHILQEIEAVCERVIVLIDGTLAANAPLAELTGGHTLVVSIDGSATDVDAVLGAIDGVTRVEHVGDDPRQAGFVRWRAECTDDRFPVQEVIDACGERDWKLASVAPETKTLEAVFAELERAHVAESAAFAREAAE